ncbi:MAG: rhodanese-like domain-containing protein [Spirochaetia bacterium]|nr:rhodanese-like domain-containing protein [Spirochaetia bacterium]
MFNFFSNVEEINPNEVYKKVNEGHDILMLDVREPDEYDHIRIENSVLIPRGILENGHVGHNYQKEAQSLEDSKNKEVIVVCRSGVRSLHSAKFLKDKGFQNVKSMQYGVIGWAQNGYPVNGKILQQA